MQGSGSDPPAALVVVGGAGVFVVKVAAVVAVVTVIMQIGATRRSGTGVGRRAGTHTHAGKGCGRQQQ